MSRILLIEPQYFGNVAYYALMSSSEELLLEVQQHFVKQTYRNRTTILGANGPLNLVVPVNFGNRTPFSEVTIDYAEPWNIRHLRAIQSSYAKSPFFDHYFPLFQPVLQKKYRYLQDLTVETMTICLSCVQTVRSPKYTQHYIDPVELPIQDLRDVVHPKKDFFKLFLGNLESYFQNFGKEFVPGLSILDLLFSLGPEAGSYISRQALID